MRPNNLFLPPLLSTNKAPAGFVLIVVVLLVGAVLSVILVQTALGALTVLEQSRVALSGTQAKIHASSCADEALIHLSRNADYGGGSFSLGTGSCVVIVGGSGGNRSLSVQGNLNGFTRNATIQVTLDPITVVSWE